MRGFRSGGVLGAVLLALGLFAAAVAVTPHPSGTDHNPLAPGYHAIAPGEIVATRTASRAGEIIADGRTPGVRPPAGTAVRPARPDADLATPPQPRPRGDRGPPAALSP